MMKAGEPGQAVGERGSAAMIGTPAAKARSRFHGIAHLLPITGLEEYLMVEAAMLAAHAYARECAEAGLTSLAGGMVEDPKDWELALRRLGEALRV
jgi:hypothetical protein